MSRVSHVALAGFLSVLLLAACSSTPNESAPQPSNEAQAPAAAASPAPSQPAAAAPTVAANMSSQTPAGSGDPKQGKALYASKGCSGCHTIGKGKAAGPDLKGVVSRRDGAWLRQWMKDSPAMAKTDPLAIQMVAEHKGMIMPKMGLTDSQIESIIAYLAGA